MPQVLFPFSSMFRPAERLTLSAVTRPLYPDGHLHMAIIETKNKFILSTCTSVQGSTDLNAVIKNADIYAELHIFFVPRAPAVHTLGKLKQVLTLTRGCVRRSFAAYICAIYLVMNLKSLSFTLLNPCSQLKTNIMIDLLPLF